HYKCYGTGSTEEHIRERGVNVIHGGLNSLRFTPVFAIGPDEADLIVDAVRQALLHGPRIATAEAA
ncbi:MAG TPA: lysine 6-aminotransferase, partial [Xanthomonadaceae bacterium]|nr:lysine 6-aminotransferase [Xanthomonadaceae bacterium]